MLFMIIINYKLGLNIESITLFDTELLIFDVGGKVP